MKKALLAALCFIIVGFMLVNGTFALPDFDKVFQAVAALLEDGSPEEGGEGTAVDVELVSDENTKNLIPGGSVSRDFRVKNSGTGPVYFRLVYAVQYDAESWEHLNICFTAGADFTEHGWKDIIIGSTPYKMKVFTYNRELAVETTSPEVTISIAMDTAITSEEISRYRSDFLQAQALAIDPTPFTAEKGYITAMDALNAALPLEHLNPF